MNMATTKQIVLASYPIGMPKASDFRFEEITCPTLKEGQVLLKPTYISVDPYMRGRMILSKSYIEPFKLNEPLVGGVVAEVIESKSDVLKVGDSVQGMLPWATEIVADATTLRQIPKNIPASYFIGILGMPGLTAYFGLMDICKPKKGETVVISGAAGAVGTVVGQIAKIQGCHVVGLAGTDEKVELLKTEFGFDYAINYKTEDIKAKLEEYCPNGIDCYYDNVGGETSDIIIAQFNRFARMALCGQIALYNATEIAVGPRILPALLKTSSLVKGFIVSDYAERFPEAFEQLGKWVQAGQLKYTETIVNGFDNIPSAFIGLFSGENKGKMIVKI